MNKNFKPVPVADRYFNGGQSAATFFFKLQIEFESCVALEKEKAKPPRVLPRADSGYLIELANGAFTNKQGRIFYNPSDRQLDKIFNGELYGYR